MQRGQLLTSRSSGSCSNGAVAVGPWPSSESAWNEGDQPVRKGHSVPMPVCSRLGEPVTLWDWGHIEWSSCACACTESQVVPQEPKEARMPKYVYRFSEGDKDQKDLLGGKGANLAEMTRLGLPVPPGFTITTDACNGSDRKSVV